MSKAFATCGTMQRMISFCYATSPAILKAQAVTQRNFSTTSVYLRSHSHYYDVLGLTPKATNKQIKAAYYRLSKIYHPDVNSSDPTSTTKFHEITEAYEVLGNSFTRRKYDRGLLHPTHKAKTTSAEGDDETTSFTPKKHAGRGPIVTGRTKYYNFDEYYRQHYGEQVLQQFKRKHGHHGSASRSKEHFQKVKDDLKRDAVLESRASSGFLLIGIAFLFVWLLFMDSNIVQELERSPVMKDSPLLYGDVPNESQANSEKD